MLDDIKKPAEDLLKETGDYVDMRIDDAKLKITEGLSVGLGRLCAVTVILTVLALVLVTFAFACILLIGKLLGDYAAGAFIVSGAFLLLLLLLIVFRKKLFVNSFVRMFVEVFFGQK